MQKPVDIVLIELFAGMAGFAKGFIDAGFNITHHYFSEINQHAIANYLFNYPHAEFIGSVLDVSGSAIRKKHPKARIVVTFGWPCQDNSIAGKRKGHAAGTRSGLLFEAGRIVHETKCQHFVAENVKGLFSVNKGTDFYQAIRFLTYLNTDSPQYTVEMQLCNTSWLLPQNRERAYFVGHIGTRGINRIFPITESDCWPVERTYDTTQVAGKGGGHHSNMTLIACINDEGNLRDVDDTNMIGHNYGKGIDNKRQRTMIRYEIKSANKDGHEIATEGDTINYSVPSSKTRRGRVGKGIANTLDHDCKQGVMVIQKTAANCTTISKNETGTLQAGGDSGMDKVPNVVMQLNPNTESNGQQPYQQNRVYSIEGLAPTLDECAGRWGIDTMKEANCLTADAYLATGKRNRDENGKAVLTSMHDRRIRRLTEIECERLQGFPDNWTQFGLYQPTEKELKKYADKEPLTMQQVQQQDFVIIIDKRGRKKVAPGTKVVIGSNILMVRTISRTNRYKLCGNAVTKHVVQLVAGKLLKTLNQ